MVKNSCISSSRRNFENIIAAVHFYFFVATIYLKKSIHTNGSFSYFAFTHGPKNIFFSLQLLLLLQLLQLLLQVVQTAI